MYEKLLKTVTNLGSPEVLVVGDFMLDVYVYGDALRISPEAPVPVLRVTKTEYSCGGAGSVAADLAALGAIPVCLGVIGKDRNGETLRGKLTEAGADITNLLTLADRPTTSKQRLIGLAQHRHQQQLFRMDEESTEMLSDEQYEKILHVYKDKLKQADVVCLQDYNKGLLSSSICKQMIRLAKDANKKVLVDPAFAGDYSKYAGATLITPNRQEASTAVGFEIKTAETAARAAKTLAEKFDIEAVVITLDKEGAYLRAQGIDELVPTRPRSVYDVTGAGDMVLATLAITLAAGCDYKTAVQLSNITGGIEVGKFGAVTVTIDEIINEITGKNDKVCSLNSIIKKLAEHRKQNAIIVFTNGCFDVVHRGHIEFLKFCKLQGDIVVVGLNSDSSVKKIKGPDRPVNNQNDRMAVLAAMETVDYVTVFDEPDPLNLIKKIKPDVLVKGQDWAEKGVIGAEFIESYGGKVVLAPLVEGKSSTATIKKIKSLES
ncbi:MAG: D-glycero-beta-D-manno-heptose 1-phosphate adenylyltransferase [Phycisphaerae bacterium]|nr:D-glycero-beta-D-manno-heptose 1-phosphate adenylyltransferase [Phycisphaerae bacterium]MDD5381310.1 D-glycero-beta-D-manno-heptose 1-phosphate adenylyltransferase [Phycisphaerae bacterium]